MRKIKFRGKPTENNVSYFEKEEFAYGFLVIDNDQYYILLDVLDNIKRDDYVTYMVEIKSETIGQYTGLKDKNEKEIYEGDIIEIKGYSNKGYNTGLVKEIYVVEFKDFCWSCGIKSLLNLATINWASIEVIGNIYDNPELLAEKE